MASPGPCRPLTPIGLIIFIGYGIILLFIGMLFCEFVFVYVNEISHEFECEFKNVNCEYDGEYECCDLFDGFYYGVLLSPTHRPRSSTVDFNGTDIALCTSNVVGCIFVYGENNKNFCDPHDYGVLLSPPATLAPTPRPRLTVFYFNVIGIGICANDFVLCKYGFVCNMINEIIYSFIENFYSNGYDCGVVSPCPIQTPHLTIFICNGTGIRISVFNVVCGENGFVCGLNIVKEINHGM